MVFETYKYDDDNQAARNAVANNGIVQINFHKELIQVQWPVYNNTITTTYPSFSGSSGSYYGTGLNLCSGTHDAYYSNASTTQLQGDITFTSSINSVYCMQQDLSFVSDEPEIKSRSPRKLSKSLKETGRVEKGEKSDQKFKSVDVQFETHSFHTVVYRLKPMSEKNSYTKEVREYCTTCGYRLRNDKWMFCPKCGEKL
jgi:hypothetical protein